MSLSLTNPEFAAIAIAAAVIIAVAAWLFDRRRRATTAKLRERFGTEYERTVQKQGSQRAGQAKLQDREKRVGKLTIRDLEPAERERFLEQWKVAQSHFLDSPKAAVTEADELVSSLMQCRGYPVSDFEQRAADISVDHPLLTENYRTAHATALQLDKSETSAEDLRTAMLHYRSLFDELVDVRALDTKQAA
jgi:hypothetical protein